MFGESSFDRRDYGFAFAALKASLYTAHVMAARGHMSELDIDELRKQVMESLEIVPHDLLPQAGRDAVSNTFDDMKMAARTASGKPIWSADGGENV